jgi:hypothetical protein
MGSLFGAKNNFFARLGRMTKENVAPAVDRLTRCCQGAGKRSRQGELKSGAGNTNFAGVPVNYSFCTACLGHLILKHETTNEIFLSKLFLRGTAATSSRLSLR